MSNIFVTYRDMSTDRGDSEDAPDYPISIHSASLINAGAGDWEVLVSYYPALGPVLDDEQLAVAVALADAGSNESPWAWAVDWPDGADEETAAIVVGELEAELQERRETRRTIGEGRGDDEDNE